MSTTSIRCQMATVISYLYSILHCPSVLPDLLIRMKSNGNLKLKRHCNSNGTVYVPSDAGAKTKSWNGVQWHKKLERAQLHVTLGESSACVMKRIPSSPLDDPHRKFKGRVVFQGNQVRGQNWNTAMFQELSSCPAAMGAAKAAECYGLIPGHKTEQADAVMAYTQSKLGGVPTWVRLPRD